jgi:polar amino acid transport system substrate-binding protein
VFSSARRSDKRRRGRLAATALSVATAVGLAVPAGAASAASSPTVANASGSKVAAGVRLDKALQALLPAQVRKSGTLVIGAQLQQPPDDYYAADGKTPVGFEVNLAHALGNALGLKISYQAMAFDSLITSLQDNRVDITMSAMNDTALREKSVNFVDYLVDGIGFLVQAGNPDHITGPMSFCGKSVTVVAGTTQQAYAAQLSAQCKAKGKGAINVVVGTSTAQEDESLTTGRVAAVFNDNITDAYDVQTQPKLFSAVNYRPIEPGPYGIGVNKHDPQLLNAVRQALQHLMATGAYKQILSAWDLGSVAVPKATVNDSKLS